MCRGWYRRSGNAMSLEEGVLRPYGVLWARLTGSSVSLLRLIGLLISRLNTVARRTSGAWAGASVRFYASVGFNIELLIKLPQQLAQLVGQIVPPDPLPKEPLPFGSVVVRHTPSTISGAGTPD
jgi:hypothetical protein